MAEMYMKIMDITPQIATEFLNNNPLNRNANQRNVNAYIRELQHGEFELTHQGIAIAEDGSLVDGQHRLLAIEQSGRSARMVVIFNAPRSSKIDRGRARRDQDALYMSGKIKKDNPAYKRVTFPLARMIVMRSLGSLAANNLTPDNRLSIYNKYKDVIDQVVEIVEQFKGNRGAPVLYAMCCACNAGVSKDVLYKWYKIVATGDFYDEDKSALKAGRSVLRFKNYIETVWNTLSVSIEKIEDVIKKAMSSINYFANNQAISKLYGSFCYKELSVNENDLFQEVS